MRDFRRRTTYSRWFLHLHAPKSIRAHSYGDIQDELSENLLSQVTPKSVRVFQCTCTHSFGHNVRTSTSFVYVLHCIFFCFFHLSCAPRTVTFSNSSILLMSGQGSLHKRSFLICMKRVQISYLYFGICVYFLYIKWRLSVDFNLFIYADRDFSNERNINIRFFEAFFACVDAGCIIYFK